MRRFDSLSFSLARRAVLALAGCALVAGAAVGCDVWPWEPTKDNPLYCEKAGDCKDPAHPVCDTVAHECKAGVVPDLGGCTTSAGCAPATPVCASGACRACSGAGDDAACAERGGGTPRCGAAGACVACRADTQAADCADKSKPVCDATGACRACRAHAECGEGACLPDGTCAAADKVAWVDNGGMKPATCAAAGQHDGKQATPYCDVQNGVDSGKEIVVVAGSAEGYGPVTIVDRTSTILGPGKGAKPLASIQGGNKVAGLDVRGAKSVVIVDGIDVNAASSTAPGIICTGAIDPATLTISHSSIHDNNGVGIDSTRCKLTAEASIVASNQAGGIKVAGGTYTITNSIIAANSNCGLTLDASSSGTVAFATIAKNTTLAGVGGIDCGGGTTKEIVNSIVWGNTQEAGTQFGAKCVLKEVVTGADNAGTIKIDPAFVDLKNADFHLKPDDAANAMCCIDKIMSPMTPNADHDVDGTRRPLGAAWDIGAHEAK